MEDGERSGERMMLEIDEVAIAMVDWIKLLKGLTEHASQKERAEAEAVRITLRAKLQRMELYAHAFSAEPHCVAVSLRDLHRYGVIDYVKVIS